jgi:hypothetical protein
MPPAHEWRNVAPQLTSGAGPCCAPPVTTGPGVLVPVGTRVITELGVTISDTIRRPAIIELRTIEPVVVDGRTVITLGARVRAVVVRADRPTAWGKSGTLALLLTSVEAVDGQELFLGELRELRGRPKSQWTRLAAPWISGGHAKMQAGTRIEAAASVPVVVRVGADTVTKRSTVNRSSIRDRQ